jgi:hypothetical protein
LYFFYLLYQKRGGEAKRLGQSGALITGLIVLLFWNPYISNMLQGHNPAYPALGRDKPIVKGQGNERFDPQATALEKLFISTFTEPGHAGGDVLNNPLPRKWPFTVYHPQLSETDTRFAGFGWWWSGILLLSLILWHGLQPDTEEKKRLSRLALLSIAATVLIHPHAWWARYVPQFWALPLFIAVFSAAYGNRYCKWKLTVPVFILLLIINNLISIDYAEIWRKPEDMRGRLRLARTAAEEQVEVSVYYKWPYDELFIQNLVLRRIPYRVVQEEEFIRRQDEFTPLTSLEGQILLTVKKPASQR